MSNIQFDGNYINAQRQGNFLIEPNKNNDNDNKNNDNDNDPVSIPAYSVSNLASVTIKQILLAQLPKDDDEQFLYIDGKRISQITIMGTVKNIMDTINHVTIQINDLTSTIDVKLWNVDDNEQLKKKMDHLQLHICILAL